MIEVNIHHIPEEGLKISGECLDDVLEIPIDERTLDISPLIYDLNLSMTQNQLIIRGEVSVVVDACCDSCLCEHELIVEDNDVCHVVENPTDLVDLTEQVREDIVLAFPQTYLCNPDCQGICACGKNLNTEECVCIEVDDFDAEEEQEDGEEKKSPWDSLDNLKFD